MNLYYGPPNAGNYCVKKYKQPGWRCPNNVDFYLKIPDGRGDDWRKAWPACAEHLAQVTWEMQQAHGGYQGDYLLRASRLPA